MCNRRFVVVVVAAAQQRQQHQHTAKQKHWNRLMVVAIVVHMQAEDHIQKLFFFIIKNKKISQCCWLRGEKSNSWSLTIKKYRFFSSNQQYVTFEHFSDQLWASSSLSLSASLFLLLPIGSLTQSDIRIRHSSKHTVYWPHNWQFFDTIKFNILNVLVHISSVSCWICVF